MLDLVPFERLVPARNTRPNGTSAPLREATRNVTHQLLSSTLMAAGDHRVPHSLCLYYAHLPKAASPGSDKSTKAKRRIPKFGTRTQRPRRRKLGLLQRGLEANSEGNIISKQRTRWCCILWRLCEWESLAPKNKDPLRRSCVGQEYILAV